jgi:hypothetical protein
MNTGSRVPAGSPESLVVKWKDPSTPGDGPAGFTDGTVNDRDAPRSPTRHQGDLDERSQTACAFDHTTCEVAPRNGARDRGQCTRPARLARNEDAARACNESDPRQGTEASRALPKKQATEDPANSRES